MADRDSGARRALPGEGTGMSGVVELAEQLAVAVKENERLRVEREDEINRLANDLASEWRERAEKAEAEVTVWKTRLVEETARLRDLLGQQRAR